MKKLREIKDAQSYLLQAVLLSCSDSAQIALSEIQIPSQYLNLSDAFFKVAVNTLSEHAAHDLSIDTQEKNSSFRLIYNLFAKKLRILRDYIEKHLKKEFITFSTSSAEASVLFITKKDEELRLCVDYRELNEIIVKNRYSLSLIEETLNRLVKAKIYIKLDIRVVYNLIRVRANDE